jgi:hypothetical protein
MLQRTGAGIAPQTHQRPADRGRLAPAYSGRRANPRLTKLLSDLPLDASSRDIDRACSFSGSRQVDRLFPVSPIDKGTTDDPSASGKADERGPLKVAIARLSHAETG